MYWSLSVETPSLVPATGLDPTDGIGPGRLGKLFRAVKPTSAPDAGNYLP